MRIVFHGANAETFLPGLAGMLDAPHQITLVSDALSAQGEAETLAGADVVIGVHYGAGHPALAARLYHLPSAGYDGIDMDALPASCAVCNCFGHEQAIAEYVMAALLARHVPLVEADAKLRRGDWHYWAGKPTGLRSELGAQSIGIVGHGHIGKTLAARALAFGMQVHVANRSPVQAEGYAATYGLDRLAEMAGRVDILINTLPLTDDTRSLIGAADFAALRTGALIMNVGRGAVIDEAALFEALQDGRLSAILDTWYVYPSAKDPEPQPSRLPFRDLSNVTMTPHMSGWTHGTIRRRQQTLAQNINRLAAGKPLINLLRTAET